MVHVPPAEMADLDSSRLNLALNFRDSQGVKLLPLALVLDASVLLHPAAICVKINVPSPAPLVECHEFYLLPVLRFSDCNEGGPPLKRRRS